MRDLNLRITEDLFIHYLVNMDYDNALHLLETLKINVNYTSPPQNTTLLIYAAISKSPKIMNKLLELGADGTLEDFRTYNFIDCIKYFSYMHAETVQYITNEKSQRNILKKFPTLYNSFKKHGYLNDVIKKEFDYLEKANTLNLL